MARSKRVSAFDNTANRRMKHIRIIRAGRSEARANRREQRLDPEN